MRADLEKALGFALSSLVRMKEGSSPNYRAVRASDGFPFLVKLLPPSRAWTAPNLLQHLKDMSGTKCVRRLFPEAPEKIGEDRLICLEWCAGTRKMPHQLRPDELRLFLDDYGALSMALQCSTHAWPADDLLKWRTAILAMKSPATEPLRRLLEREIPEEEVTRRPELDRIIYGDFHHGNFVFRDGRVHRYFDLEAISHGYPSEDIVRYFVCAFEHLPLGGFGCRGRLLKAFAEAVRYLPYSRHEWLLALDGQLLRKFDGYGEEELGRFRVWKLMRRAGLYLHMKELVRECK